MKKETLSALIFLATITLITAPLIILTSGAATDNFSANVTVGNNAPTIDFVVNGSDSPNGATTKTIYINFTVTDENGVLDLVTVSSFVNITRAGEATRTSTDCWSTSNVSNTQNITCQLDILYYDEPGAWDICAYVTDGTDADSDCTTADFTMGNTDDVDIIETALSFSGNAGDTNIGATENPLVVNNTGNRVYSGIDLTAYNLTGGVDTIGATAFTVNVTDGSGEGQALAHSSPVTITSASIAKAEAAGSASEDLYFYLDIPTGIAATDYNTGGTPWMIDPTI